MGEWSEEDRARFQHEAMERWRRSHESRRESQQEFMPSKSELIQAEFWIRVWFIVLVGLLLDAVFG